MNEHIPKPTAETWRWIAARPDLTPKPPTRLPARKKFDVAEYALPGFALATGAMVGLSAPQLIDPSGILGWTKICILTVSSTLVSYIVNRYAVEHGAELAGRGFVTAGIVSVGSMLIVGGGLFASTYAGLTIERVNDLKLQQHGQTLAAYAEAANVQAPKSLQTRPIVDAAVADVQLHLACEEKESCLSGRSKGGRGRVTRTLEPIATRTTEISTQLQKGDATRSDRLARVNELIGDYQTTFSNGNLQAVERRRTLSRIDAQIKQEIGALIDALPVALLKAYGVELEKGIVIADQPEATRNISSLLRRHGRAILTALEGKAGESLTAPAFPEQAGVSATFAYIGHFLPMAALTAVIELVMPLTLWVYVLLGHLWRNFRDDPHDPRHQPPTNPSPLTGGGHGA